VYSSFFELSPEVVIALGKILALNRPNKLYRDTLIKIMKNSKAQEYNTAALVNYPDTRQLRIPIELNMSLYNFSLKHIFDCQYNTHRVHHQPKYQ